MAKKSEIHEQIMSLLEDATDEKHLKCKDLHDSWTVLEEVSNGDIRLYNDKLYRFISTEKHICAEEYNPERANYLWVEITDPSVEWPDWKQPAGYADAYAEGAKVTHKNKKWVSDVDNNTWEPGVYGWTEAK